MALLPSGLDQTLPADDRGAGRTGSFGPPHPFIHPDALRAWGRVTTEEVLDQQELDLPDGQLVVYYLIGASPYWAGLEAAVGVPAVWQKPVVYSPSPYAALGGAGLANVPSARATIRRGRELAVTWRAQALVVPHLTSAAAARVAQAHEPDVSLFTNLWWSAPVHPDGLAGHLAANPNRRAAGDHGREVRRGSDAGLRLRVLRGAALAAALPGLAALTGQVDAKHGTAKYGLDVLEALSATPGALLLVAEYKGRMAGAFLSFAYGDALYLSTAGLDYELLRELHTYAWLLGEALDFAARTGATTVHVGRSNHRTKRRWGFQSAELRTLVYLTNPADRSASERLTQLGSGLAALAHGYAAPGPA